MYPNTFTQDEDRVRRGHAGLRKGAMIGVILGSLWHPGLGTGIGAFIGALAGFYIAYRRASN